MKLNFDWDQWNIQKNEEKHGISRLDAESLFYDANLVLYKDTVHSSAAEKRWIGYGVGIDSKVLMVAFTIRKNKIRIISCRTASKKERVIYEKQKHNHN